MKISAHTRLLHDSQDDAEIVATVLLADVDLELADAQAFQILMRKELMPGVEAARKTLERTAAAAAARIRAWALIHIKQARQLGRDTALFEKLINDPLSAARQFTRHLMGISPTTAGERKLDSVLSDIAM